MTGLAMFSLLFVLFLLVVVYVRYKKFLGRLKAHIEIMSEVCAPEKKAGNRVSLEDELTQIETGIIDLKTFIDENRRLKDEVNTLKAELGETRIHLENKVRELNALFDFATTIGQLGNGLDIYRVIPDSIEEHLGLDEVSIYQIDEEKKCLVPVGCSARLERALDGREVDLSDPVVGKVFVSGEPLYIPDIKKKGIRESVIFKNSGSVIAFPVKKRDRTVGVFVITSPEPNSFDGETVAMVKTLTKFISISLENMELYQYAKMMAERDSLTHLYNHGTFHSRLNYELERSSRYGRDLSVIMFDIDGFKMINDNFGHTFGDRVLKMVAGIVNAHLRKTDIPARYGGDEFAVLLPETGLEAAKVITQRICEGLSNLSLDSEKGGGITVSASFGVTSCKPDTPGREKIVQVADELMYRAKARGFGQIECAPM